MNEQATRTVALINKSISCESCPKAKLLDGGSLQIITYGFVAPPIILVTLVTNFFVCLVLLKKKMRNQTSVLLVALSISDSLTGLLPLPFFIYFYTAGNYKYHLPFVPYEVCSAYVVFKELLPTISHTCSIWLTVTLALQRYFCVCRPSVAKTLEIAKTLKIIAFVFVMSVAIHVCRFAEYSYVPVSYKQNLYKNEKSLHVNNSTVATLSNSTTQDRLACYRIPWSFYERHKTIYFYIYYLIFRAVFIHILPCVLLVIMNYILIREMRKARDRRIKLLKTKMHGTSSNPCEGQASTLMLVVVVGCFLLVELPLAVLFILLIASDYLKISILSPGAQVQASVVLNACIMFSYPINFFIYCIMSRSFRQSFVNLFKSRPRQTRPEHSSLKTAERPQFLALKNLKESGMNVIEVQLNVRHS